MKVVGLFLLGLVAVTAVPVMPEGESMMLDSTRRGRGTPTPAPTPVADEYHIGVGKSDITGPIGGKVSGYDIPETSTTLHSRSFARAFAFYQEGEAPVVFAVAERWIVSNFVYNLVLKDIMGAYPEITRNNLIISATHTHSASHVWSDYSSLQLSSGDYPAGLSDKVYAKGLITAIHLALDMAKTTKGKIMHSTIADANDPKIAIQRSHKAFEKNTDALKAELSSEELDPRMTVLKFVKDDSTPLGMINWFNVQGTSTQRSSQVLTAGNKGVAAKLFERSMEAQNPAFVAAFANGGYGDSSPNVDGPKCTDTGASCDFGKTNVTYSELTKVVQFETPESNCGGNYQKCQAFGPLASFTKDAHDNMVETGTRQFNKAKEIWDGSSWSTVSGAVKSATKYFNIRTAEPSCPGALGFSYLSGTIDGTVLDTSVINLGASEALEEVPTNSSLNSDMIRSAIDMVTTWTSGEVATEAKACQGAKSILAADQVGNYTFFPAVASVSVISIGEGDDAFAIGGVPVSPTAGSAYEMETSIRKAVKDNRRIVIAAPTNDYIGYATTEEEYSAQRFEGGATVYGPKTAAKLATKLEATAACALAGNCDAHLAFDAPECTAGVIPDNCPPFFDETASSRLTSGPRMAVDFAKQHGMDFSDAGFEALHDEKRGSLATDVQGVGTNHVYSAEFYVSGKWTIDNVDKRFSEVQCALGRRYSTVFTDEDHEMSSFFKKSGEDLVATVSWRVPEGFNTGGSSYRNCKIVAHTYDDKGENEKTGESAAFDAPERA